MAIQDEHVSPTDSETESDDLNELYFNAPNPKRVNRGFYVGKGTKTRSDRERVVGGQNGPEEAEMKARKAAEQYQQHMKQIPIPPSELSPVLFKTWQGLAKLVKQKYEQPLHYLTMKLLKEWDQSRIGSKEEGEALENIIDPVRAEAAIWVVEHFHRQCSSPDHLAKLWVSDPMYQDFAYPMV